MAYEQAFHTCCPGGLATPSLAFQFNAASAGLDAAMLRQIENAMTGYVPPVDAPPAPTAEELAEFPVSLRYRDVAGVGPCLSRTVYVGREDRASGGVGEGRFGNYFSHVVAAPGASRFVEGLHPIELWDAPMWTAEEHAGVELPALPAPRPVPGTLSRALDLLEREARTPWLPALLEAVAQALDGRCRVVVSDDAQLGWAWVAAAAFVLPDRLAQRLSFDTFAADAHLSDLLFVATTPAADRAALEQRAHTGEIVVLEPGRAEHPPAPETLLGRAATTVAERGGARAITEALRSVPEDHAPVTAALAAHLAVAASDASLLEPGDLATVLAEAAGWWGLPGDPRLDMIAALVAGAASAGGPSTPADLAAAQQALKVAASQAASPAATCSALVALLVAAVDRVTPDGLPWLPREAVGFDAIGQALEVLPENLDAPTTAHRLQVLSALGLIGVNAELDRRAGRAAARHMEDDRIRRLVAGFAQRPEGRDVVEHALWALAVVVERGLPLDGRVAADLARDPLRRCLHDLARGPDRFAAALLAGRVAVASRADRRDAALEHLLSVAGSGDEREEAIAALYPSIAALEDLSEVVAAHAAVELPLPSDLVERAWSELGAMNPFRISEPAVRRLTRSLVRLDEQARHRPAVRGLVLAERWAEPSRELRVLVAELAEDWATLTPGHADALAVRLAHDAAAVRDAQEHCSTALRAMRVAGGAFTRPYAAELQRRLARGGDADLAHAALFSWLSEGRDADEPHRAAMERVLQQLARGWDRRFRDEIGGRFDVLGVQWTDYWNGWCDQNPEAGAVARGVSRLRGRRP